jgi:RNA polymerase sigma-70 factor (ECF subfamily)
VQGSGFDALVRPHLDRLYRLAYRFTQSREDAEDLVQSLLIKLLPQAERLALLDLPGPWMARALYNLYIDQTRQRRRQEAAIGSPLTEDGVLEAIADEFSDSPEQAVERSQREQRLALALATLSDDHRALIAWHDMEGYTLDELAEQLSVPIGTLKSRLHRGRANLRALLEEPSAGATPLSVARFAV